MDIAKRNKLISETLMPGNEGSYRNGKCLPLVSLEDFFDGNDDYGSIGCNLLLDEHPGPDGFYAALASVRNRPEVQDVLVEIYQVDEGQWPYSERVYVLANAAKGTVTQWLEPLHPDDVAECGTEHLCADCIPELWPGVIAYAAWWD